MSLRIPQLLTGLICLFSASIVLAQNAGDPNHPGRAVYEQNCATCHGNPEVPRAHAFAVLRMMNAEALGFALTEGLMSAQGSTLSSEETSQLIGYLANENGAEAWVASMMCAEDKRTVDLDQTLALTHFGGDVNNSRSVSAQSSGLQKSDMANLELAWSIGFPQVTGLRASPVIIGTTIFYAVQSTKKVLAIDTQSGCVKWAYESPNPMRASLTYGVIGENNQAAILFGDARGFVQAIDAKTGEGIWVKDAKASNNGGRISGAIVLHEDKIIVPISDSGVGAGANPNFECCIGHGAVTALDAASGEKLWEYHTVRDATYTGEVNSVGAKLRGPSGAPIWSTPTVDAKRGFVYVTTGENTSYPATDTSDAIIALDLETGEQKWLFQALPNDVWNMACGRRNGANCPSQGNSILKDYDFGGPAILVERDNEPSVLLAGQKSGDLWAINPDNGEVIWNQRIGDGSALGGNHWGIATDGVRVFHPINDPIPAPGSTPMPGMYSFFIGTGEPSWSFPLSPDCDNGRAERVSGCEFRYGLSATPLVVDGAIISAGLDGRVFIFDGDNGEVLFQFDSAIEFDTVNGIAGKGGSVDAHSIAAGAGMVFIGSGYGSFGQTPGNVLLAFKPKSN